MNMQAWLKEQMAADKRRAMPIHSFPSIQLVGITVKDLIAGSGLQARGMHEIACRCPTAAYHFGNAVSMEDMIRQMLGDVLTMGNVDPVSAIRNGTPEKVRQDTLSIMDACCKYPNFLISSGCDIPPAAP